MGWRYDDYSGYPRSQPRAVKGGIKAQAQRGAFGTTWWAKRWIAVLESFDLGPRLTRGKSYARSGQVLTIDVSPGQVTARVQGSRPDPYAVTIEVQTLSGPEWTRLVDALAGEARFAASLLAGRMPEDVEQAFAAAGLSLFPARREDLRTTCTCPDWSNPCKHIAAVYYLLGEEFDRDPFLIFKLRGLDQDELVRLLDRAMVMAPAASPARPAAEDAEARAPEPLPAGPGAFWQGAELPEGFPGEIEPPPATAALLARLGPFPFWRGRQPLGEALAPVYTAAAARGLDVLAGPAVRSGPDPARIRP